MVRFANFPARVQYLYDEVRRLRSDLDAPDILEGSRLYETLVRYGDEFREQDYYGVADYLSVRSREAHVAALAVVEKIVEVVGAVATGQYEATDMVWKRRSLSRIKELIDEFLSIPPNAGVNGGRRRNTRKRRLRRHRYSRRR